MPITLNLTALELSIIADALEVYEDNEHEMIEDEIENIIHSDVDNNIKTSRLVGLTRRAVEMTRLCRRIDRLTRDNDVRLVTP